MDRQTKLGINFDPSGRFTLANAADFSPESLTKIVPWGQFFTMDTAGYMINDCHTDKILSPWTTLVAELRQGILDIWKNRLQGLYLRGSVPRGLAILKVSDLDSFAILSGEITQEDIDQARIIRENLTRRYLFCKKVELILFDCISIGQSDWPVIIQTQSLKIAGDYCPLHLAKIKPGADLIHYAYTWEEDLTKTLNYLENLSLNHLNFSAQVKKQCAWITRRMVRVGFELIMEQDQCYTPDLYYCYQRFSAYFPEHQTSMRKALELAIAPSQNRPGLIIFLRSFGRCLVEEIKQILPVKAPELLIESKVE